jgi:DNA-directed RNA polymerase specialized sigma24 family protein
MLGGRTWRGVRDRDGFELLFAEHARAVFAYSLRRTDRATAEEVVGEVFVVRRADDARRHEPPAVRRIGRA